MVALSKRYRRSRARLQEFLHDGLGVWVSTGAIHEALAEVAAELCSKVVDEQLIEEAYS
jgi:hypothetical protein